MNNPTLVERLQRLIATPSVSSVSPSFDQSNRAVIDLLANWLDDLGFNIEVMPLPNQPNKANLIATLGKGEGGLVLSGHTDTVPYDETRWQTDPFRLTEKDNRYYGLGTADMKSFFGLAIEAALKFRAGDLKKPLILLATADEESSMDGARSLVEADKPRARYAIIGEPTLLKPIRAHKGIIMESVRVIGNAGHSSNPHLGNNALEGMHKVISAILAWRDELQKNTDEHFAVSYPTLNLGHIHGGDNPNRICGSCECHFDLRPLPGMEPDALRQELNDLIQNTLDDTGLNYEFRSLIEGTPPMHTPANAEIVQTAEKFTGSSAECVAFCTEGPYLNQLGMQTIVMGPGNIDQAHQPDEYLTLDQIRPTINVLEKFIQHYCIQTD